MKVKLPMQTKQIIDGKLKRGEWEKEFELDMSLASEMRYEAKFPELAEREDLFSYSKRICEIKEHLSTGLLISKMKMLYCWFDTEESFVDFLKMFDLADEVYVGKLTSKMQEVFSLIFNGSAEKN